VLNDAQIFARTAGIDTQCFDGSYSLSQTYVNMRKWYSVAAKAELTAAPGVWSYTFIMADNSSITYNVHISQACGYSDWISQAETASEVFCRAAAAREAAIKVVRKKGAYRFIYKDGSILTATG
jgi:N-acetyl-beta-hexosaminidase